MAIVIVTVAAAVSLTYRFLTKHCACREPSARILRQLAQISNLWPPLSVN